MRSVELGESSWGLNPALSRMVRTSEPARPMFLVPGDGLLGVYEPGGSGGVLPFDRAVTGESVGSAFRGTGRIEVSGLLPDTVGHVAVVRRNGEVIETSVPENVYAVMVDAGTADALPSHIRFVLDGEERVIAVPGADEEVLTLR